MNTDADKSNDINTSKFATVADLIHEAGTLPGTTVGVVGGDRVEDLRLVESAWDHGIVDRIVLIGNGERMKRAMDQVDIDVAPTDIIATEDDQATGEAAVRLIQDGTIDIVLKGNISTPVINRAMLPLAIRSTVSLVTMFDAAPIADGRPMLLTDAGVTTMCSPERLVNLIENAIEVARKVMGLQRPRVALLSANEKQIKSLPSTQISAELSQREWKDAVVYGPLSLDLAIDPASVAVKGLPDLPGAAEVAGHADILVCPGIDAANILYKSISAMCKYGIASMASVTIGFPVPYIILSRADTLETRLASIALCSLYARSDK